MHNQTGCSLSRTTLSSDRRAQQPTTGQNWLASRSPSVAASVGGAPAASKLSGATADVSQQRSREARGPRQLAALAGRGGGVTAAAWGSLCDTITTTLCWCRGSLCLQQIPPVPPSPARSGHSCCPRLWLPPAYPRDVTLQPSRRLCRLGGSAAPTAAAFTAAELRFFVAAARGGGGGGGGDKVGCRSRTEIGGVFTDPSPGGGVGVGVVNSLRFHEILRSVARYRRRCHRRFR